MVLSQKWMLPPAVEGARSLDTHAKILMLKNHVLVPYTAAWDPIQLRTMVSNG